MDYVYNMLFDEIQVINGSIRSKEMARDQLYTKYHDLYVEILQMETLRNELMAELRKREIESNDYDSMTKHDFDDFVNNLIEEYNDEI